MKKVIGLALCALLSVSMLAGCASNNGTNQETSTAKSVTLKTVSMFGGNDPAATGYADLVKEYETATGNKVQDSSDTANEDWKASVVADFNTGNEPDVIFFFNAADGAPLLDKVVTVDTIRAKYPDYAKDINPSALAGMAEADGTIYAVPVKGFFEGIFCNKDLFDENGLELPTTWDNLVKAIETFRAKGIDPFAISFSEEPHYFIEAVIMSAGGVAEHKVVPTTDIASVPDSWEKGLDVFKTLGDMGAFPSDAATKKSSTAQDDFLTKKAAMLMDGSWRTGAVVTAERADQVALVAFPQIPGGKGTGKEIVAGFSSGFYITKKAWDNPDIQKAAVDFVNSMTSKKAVEILLAGGANTPAANIDISADTLVFKSGLQMVADAGQGLDAPVDSRLKKAAWVEIWTKVGEIASGKLTAKEVLENAIPQNKD